MEEDKRFGRSLLGAGGGCKVAKNRLPGRLEKGLNSLVRGPGKRGGGEERGSGWSSPRKWAGLGVGSVCGPN